MDNKDNKDATNHTTQEDSALSKAISEKPLKHYNNQVILKTFNYNPAKPATKPIFETEENPCSKIYTK